MPIYEYRCPSCGFQKEHLQKMSDDPLSSCPSCGDAGYAKLLSAAGFVVLRWLRPHTERAWRAARRWR